MNTITSTTFSVLQLTRGMDARGWKLGTLLCERKMNAPRAPLHLQITTRFYDFIMISWDIPLFRTIIR